MLYAYLDCLVSLVLVCYAYLNTAGYIWFSISWDKGSYFDYLLTAIPLVDYCSYKLLISSLLYLAGTMYLFSQVTPIPMCTYFKPSIPTCYGYIPSGLL